MIPAFCTSLLSRAHRGMFAMLVVLFAVATSFSTANAAQVSLTWNANPQPEVAGYMLYYGQGSGAYTNKVDVSKVTAFTVTGLQEGKTYYYAVTAYDAGRAESPFSNEANATTAYSPPVAAFNADKTSDVAPASIIFTSTSTGTVSSYSWNFGDGTSSAVQSPSHIYSTAGTYSVSLTTTGPGGSNTSTRAGYIAVTATPVIPPPVAGFSAAGTSGQAPLAATFTSTSTGSISSYSWNFGDGTSSTLQNPSHSYAAAGTYTVSLTVSGSGGSNTSTRAGLIVVSAPPVVAAPTANFTATGMSGQAPLAVAFTSTSTGSISSYSWNFGDGTSSTAQTPSHSYATAGTYTVSLKVTGSGGSNTMTKSGFVVVSPPASSGTLTANFTVDKTSAAVGETVALTSASTGPITKAVWNFGDGSAYVKGSSVTHSFKKTGSFKVYLTVYSSTTNSTFSKSITVSQTPSVTANFTANVTSGPAPLSVTFTSTSTGTVSAYYWTFGDGAVASDKSTTHIYSKAGSYSVSLKVTGANGDVTTTKAGFITAQGSAVKPGLVAAYNFDAGTGTSLADLAGTNTGTITKATWAANGHSGKALLFNGVDSWVTVSDAASLDLSTGMTLEAWVYPTTAQSGWTNIIMKEQATASVYYLSANSDINVPVGGAFVGGAERALAAKSTLPLNTWTHLATTYDGVTQKFYVNGVLVSSRAQTGAIQASTGALRIGGDSIWGEYFKGMIDDVRIYNRAASISEIQADLLSPVSN